MATGGWGYSVNPFAQGGSATAPPAPAEEAPRQQNAFGAWGGGVGTAAPAPAASPKPNALAAAFNIAPGGGGGGGGAGGGNLAQREAELARREAELARREAALAQIAENSKPSVSAWAGGARSPLTNFPPFCPFMYHSISEQIPAWNRSMIRFTFVIELLEILGAWC
ncbi:hypothetical protein MNEG_4620 [Monoraphidium neglectum]|uniref:Secretory carrier membrane protein n=1 Tax=Monoraphidium neglectum TaxID=145388 RepID=A0A0D2MSE1_9CHLO|nr:hypothetical protein MNEG_4620 [Monoraphidium neglectum]KIZ03332.1 hypothetical protein MNEG_4620 [Monoraphidium neglectum]|eukprot:XP_013902351.1 hypothetical protein MNEG_4620 [Monoraphidium neglectum]